MSSLMRLMKPIIGLRQDPGNIPFVMLLPLRLFLGITFIYAGLNKFTDPQFFSPAAPNFIGKQMSSYVQSGSPLSPLLTHLAIPHAVFFGAVIALGELWIGISTLLGLFTRLGALGGLVTNLIFFLTATWGVQPYFLGGDLPYAAGWLTLMLAGPGLYSLDEYFFGQATRASRNVAGSDPSAGLPYPSSPAHERMSRAAYLRGLGVAAVLAVVGVFFAGAAKLVGADTDSSTSPTARRLGSGGGSAEKNSPTGASASTSSSDASSKKLGNVSSVPENSAAQYTDPGSGDPALLVHLPSGKFVSYDAVCTHAGCTVGYDPNQSLIVCPCHGAVYDPAHGAKVLAGPAPYPLKKLKVNIKPNGNVYPAS